jgi:hypothetical protein
MIRPTYLLIAALLVPTNLGVTIESAGGSNLTQFGVPGQGILGQATMYATFFAGQAVLVEPQLALNVISSEGETATTVGLAGQIGYLFKGAEINSAFIAGGVGFQSVSFGGFSESDFAVGGKVGYRVLVGTSVGVRVEGGYRRWFDSELNEFSFGIGIGGIVRRTQ